MKCTCSDFHIIIFGLFGKFVKNVFFFKILYSFCDGLKILIFFVPENVRHIQHIRNNEKRKKGIEYEDWNNDKKNKIM